MTMAQLGVAYLAVGLVLGISLVVAGKLPRIEALLVLVLWPIWVPLALGEVRPVERDLRERIRYLTERVGELDRARRELVEELDGLERAVAQEYARAERR